MLEQTVDQFEKGKEVLLSAQRGHSMAIEMSDSTRR